MLVSFFFSFFFWVIWKSFVKNWSIIISGFRHPPPPTVPRLIKFLNQYRPILSKLQKR